MRILVLLTLLLCAAPGICQENEIEKQYGNQVTPADLKEYLTILASDALEGRRTGTRGQKMAAAFLSNQFQEIGLMPPVSGGYFQPFELYTSKVGEAFVKAGGTRFDHLTDIYYSGAASTGGETPVEIVFAGRGTEEDFKQVDVKDKAVLLIMGSLGGPVGSARSLSQQARDHGARIAFLVSESADQQFHEYVDMRKNSAYQGRLSFKKPDPNNPDKGYFILNRPVAEKIMNTTFEKLKKTADDPKMKSLRKVKNSKISYEVTLNLTTLPTENVLGFLEGTDKKDEVVLVTAHYDHIGKLASGDDRINNGADDDGSGTVTVLELAKIFSKAKKEGHGPRRSMLFMTVTAEEVGLLGSEYYVEHPVYPLANTVVDLNIDMIGRTDPEHKDKGNYVYVIGSDKLSSELHALSEKTNATYCQLAFDYTYNDENHPTNLYKRSDHWNFAKNGIPIVFYFDGIHEDYHKPSDEVGKIEFDLMARRAQCVFYTAWEIANRDNRLVVDKK